MFCFALYIIIIFFTSDGYAFVVMKIIIKKFFDQHYIYIYIYFYYIHIIYS